MANAHQLGCLVVLGNLVVLDYLVILGLLGNLVVLGNLVILGFLGNLVVLDFLIVLSNLGRLVVFMVSRHSCLTAHPCLLLITPFTTLLPLLLTTYYSLIKRFFKGTELVFSLNTASPPCLQEPKAIAH